MKKIYLLFLILVCLSVGHLKSLAADFPAGFIPGNIWYVPESFKEGDSVRIYTVLYNSDEREFSGRVIFFDKKTFLGKQDFVLPPGSVKDLYITWKATAGGHTIFGEIENAKFLTSPGNYEEVYLAGNQTEESKINVDNKIPEAGQVAETIKDNITEVTERSMERILDSDLGETITNIPNVVADNMPAMVGKPLSASLGAVENLRQNIAEKSEQAREAVKEILKQNTGEQSEEDDTGSKPLRPLQYLKLFFLTLVTFVFSNKIIFYGLLLWILLLLLRSLYRRYTR